MKQKILSLLFVLCLVIPMAALPVAAAELGSAVTATESALCVGQELDITVALTHYEGSAAGIRGLQIDLGIDTAVWEVVSYRSEIVDAAEQNKVTYHEADGLVRLLYLNLSGVLDRAAEEVLTLRLRLKEGVTADGSTTFPVTLKLATTTGNVVLTNEVTVAYHSAAPGDVNNDGKINNRDLGLLMQHLNGSTAAIVVAAADVNNDGKLNNRDLGLLQQYLNGWKVELG